MRLFWHPQNAQGVLLGIWQLFQGLRISDAGLSNALEDINQEISIGSNGVLSWAIGDSFNVSRKYVDIFSLEDSGSKGLLDRTETDAIFLCLLDVRVFHGNSDGEDIPDKVLVEPEFSAIDNDLYFHIVEPVFIKLICSDHEHFVLISPVTFEAEDFVWTHVDVVGFAWGDFGLVDHVGELSGLGGLEPDRVKRVILEGSQLHRGRRPVIGLPFELELFGVHVINFSEFFLKSLVFIFYLDSQLA